MARTKAKKRKYTRRTPAKLYNGAPVVQQKAVNEKVTHTIKGDLNITEQAINDNLRVAVEKLGQALSANAETIRRGQDAAHHNAAALHVLASTLSRRIAPVNVVVELSKQDEEAHEQVS